MNKKHKNMFLYIHKTHTMFLTSMNQMLILE